VRHRIVKLNLETKTLSSQGFKSLVEFVKSDKTVQSLNLCNVCVAPTKDAEPEAPGAQGAATLAEGLKENSTLRSLYLDGWGMGNEGVAAVTAALKGTLKNDLSLGRNGLDGGAVTHLVELIQSVTGTLIYLGENHLGPKAQQEITRAAGLSGVLINLEDNAPYTKESPSYSAVQFLTKDGTLPKDDSEAVPHDCHGHASW
jgi:hypothetical protein